MLETVRKGYWKADAATEKTLLEEYVASVNRHGVGLRRTHVRQSAAAAVRDGAGLKAGIPVPALEGFKQEMEKATGQAIDPAAEREAVVRRQNDAQMAADLAAVPAPSRTARQLEGYLMEQRTEAAAQRGST